MPSKVPQFSFSSVDFQERLASTRACAKATYKLCIVVDGCGWVRTAPRPVGWYCSPRRVALLALQGRTARPQGRIARPTGSYCSPRRVVVLALQGRRAHPCRVGLRTRMLGGPAGMDRGCSRDAPNRTKEALGTSGEAPGIFWWRYGTLWRPSKDGRVPGTSQGMDWFHEHSRNSSSGAPWDVSVLWRSSLKNAK